MANSEFTTLSKEPWAILDYNSNRIDSLYFNGSVKYQINVVEKLNALITNLFELKMNIDMGN